MDALRTLSTPSPAQRWPGASLGVQARASHTSPTYVPWESARCRQHYARHRQGPRRVYVWASCAMCIVHDSLQTWIDASLFTSITTVYYWKLKLKDDQYRESQRKWQVAGRWENPYPEQLVEPWAWRSICWVVWIAPSVHDFELNSRFVCSFAMIIEMRWDKMRWDGTKDDNARYFERKSLISVKPT